MTRRRWGRTAVTLAVAAGVATSSALLGWWLVADARALAPAGEPADLLLAAVEVAAALVAARCGAAALLALLAVAGHRPGRGATSASRAAVRVSPLLLRPAVAALLAATVTTTVAGPALAAAPPSPLPSAAWSPPSTTSGPALSRTTDQPALPAATWVPDAAPAPAPVPPRLVAGPAPRPAPRPVPAAEVVVHRGDSLWAIVARALGPQASDTRIAAEWPRWYAANRAVIGDDPDLLLPGTTLQAPAGAVAR